MSGQSLQLLIVTVVIIIGLITYIFVRKWEKRARQQEIKDINSAWQKLAQLWSMKFTQTFGVLGPIIEGQYRGRKVVADLEERVEPRGRYSERVWYVNCRTTIQNDSKVQILLIERDIGAQVADAFFPTGAKRSPDVFANERYELHASPPKLLDALVASPKVTFALETAETSRLQTSSELVYLSRKGLLLTERQVASVLDLLCEIAELTETFNSQPKS